MSVINRLMQNRVNTFRRCGSPGLTLLLLMCVAFNTADVYAVDAPGDVVAAQASNASLKVTWADNSGDETGFRVQSRSSTDGGETWGSWSTETTTAANVEEWTKSTGLTSGTTYQFQVRGNGSPDSADVSSNAFTFFTYTSSDIGDVGATGSASYSSGIVTIEGSGNDIWSDADGFHYYYTGLSGDGQITARIDTLTNTASWTKAGVMIRDGLTDDAANAFMMIRPTEGAGFQYRTSGGAFSGNADAPYIQPPEWLRLTREGNSLDGYVSDDGLCWTHIGSVDVSMSGGDYIGVALTASNYGVLAEAEVSNLSIKTTVDAFNADCPRTAVDGPLAPPTQWVVQPGNLASVSWKYTFTNPNSSPAWEDCRPGSDDERYGPDDPQCPDAGVSPAWTQTGYNDSGWSSGNAGFGSNPNYEGDDVNTTWSTSDSDIWLRKTFTISSGQIDDVMLWTRWDDGITVYINGVLATSNKGWSAGYHYMGLSEAARAALSSSGTNVIAIRAKNGDYFNPGGSDDRYIDVGLGIKQELAQLPQTSGGIQTITEVGAYSDALKQFMIEQGIPGGTLAVMKGDTVVLAKGFGYKDKDLQTAMPYDALMRLASNDKPITKAAIIKLYNDNVIADLDDEVFPMFTGLQPVPGDSAGSGVNDITIRQLLDHTSGINFLGEGQASAYEKYYSFGVEPSNWSKDLNLRWLYSQDTLFTPGTQSQYSSDGYFVLRYLVEYLTQDSLKDYIDGMLTEVSTTDIFLDHERLAGRDSREPSYINLGYIKYPYDRWINLEDYLGLGGSAEAMVRFLRAYDLADGDYLLDGSGNQIVVPDGGVGLGAMDGSSSMVLQNPGEDLSIAVLFNMLGGDHSGVIRRMEEVTEQLTGPGGVWGSGGSCSNTASGGNSGSFNTTGAYCFKTQDSIAGWGVSSFDGRSISVTVNGTGTAVTTPGATLPSKGSSDYYHFDSTAGNYAWAAVYWW
ncbi:MAG TPA: serine hydrolase [Gammaproteobacteria bacterium]